LPGAGTYINPSLNHAGCVIITVYRICAIDTVPFLQLTISCKSAGATHTWHVTEGTTYVLNRTASGRDAVQSAVPGLNFYMEHQVHCQTNTCTIVLDLKGPSALVDELAVLPPWNWPSGPVFNSLQQMEGACEEGGGEAVGMNERQGRGRLYTSFATKYVRNRN